MKTLYEAARGYLGTPFRHQGRSRSGLDCVGLVVLAMADTGRVLADVTTYARNPHHGLLEAHLMAAFGPAIARTDLQPGDVVAIDFSGATRHVAIVGDYPGGGLSLIHTDSMVGRVTEHRLDSCWHDCIAGAWRP